MGAVEFCHLWILNFAVLAKPFFEATKGKEKEPMEWRMEQGCAFQILKKELQVAPVLGLPNLAKPFELYALERSKTAVGY